MWVNEDCPCVSSMSEWTVKKNVKKGLNSLLEITEGGEYIARVGKVIDVGE